MADDPKTQAFSLKDDPMFKQMVSVISALGSGLKEARTQNEALQTKLSELTEKITTKSSNGDDRQKAGPTEEEFNEMSQSDLLKHVNQAVADSIAKATGEVRKDISKVSDSVMERSIKDELKGFAKDHPDLLDLTEEMKSIIDETPGLSIARAYSLAKAENPEKAKTLAEKYKESDDTVKRPPFGGLTPTSGASPTGEDGKPLTQAKAADKAWTETLQSFPGISEILSE